MNIFNQQIFENVPNAQMRRLDDFDRCFQPLQIGWNTKLRNKLHNDAATNKPDISSTIFPAVCGRLNLQNINLSATLPSSRYCRPSIIQALTFSGKNELFFICREHICCRVRKHLVVGFIRTLSYAVQCIPNSIEYRDVKFILAKDAMHHRQQKVTAARRHMRSPPAPPPIYPAPQRF